MLSNDIKAGAKLVLTYGRKGTMRDNKKGIRRVVEVMNPFHEIGSVYINEILLANGEQVEFTKDHLKQLIKIGAWI